MVEEMVIECRESGEEGKKKEGGVSGLGRFIYEKEEEK